jgi:hypothetical protein
MYRMGRGTYIDTDTLLSYFLDGIQDCSGGSATIDDLGFIISFNHESCASLRKRASEHDIINLDECVVKYDRDAAVESFESFESFGRLCLRV